MGMISYTLKFITWEVELKVIMDYIATLRSAGLHEICIQKERKKGRE